MVNAEEAYLSERLRAGSVGAQTNLTQGFCCEVA